MNRTFLGVILGISCAFACAPTPPTGTGGGGGSAGSAGAGGSGANPFCEVKRVLDAKCTSCHASQPNSGAPMPLTSYAATRQTDLNSGQPFYSLIGAFVSSGAMPPSPQPPLTQADRDVLVNWANSGGPGSECSDSGGGDCATDPSYCIGEQYLPCKPDIYLKAHAPGDFTQKYVVPANAHDMYNCYRFKNPFYGSPVKYEIAEAAVIDNSAVIHHWLMFGSNSGVDGDVDQSGGCVGPETSDTLLSTWTPGGTNSVYPPDVGLLLNQYPILTLQTHYNNPTSTAVLDSSGVAYCSTTTTPQNIAGVVTLGQDIGISAPAGAQNYLGGSGTCTNLFASGSGTATIISSSPHMHQIGSGFTTELSRNGQHVTWVSNVPVGTWSFDQQKHYPHNELGTGRITVQPGDVLKTNCYYTNTTATNVGFGVRTVDEMCYDFLVAYPITQLKHGCGSLLVSFLH